MIWSREDEWESDDPADKMGALMMNSRTYAASGCGIKHPSVVFFGCWQPFGSFKAILSQDSSPESAGLLHYDAKKNSG